MKKGVITIVIGTRPELIKMAPVMWELQKRSISFCFVHSNQHYSKELDDEIIKNLNIPKVDYHLHVGSGSHAVQTGKILESIEPVYERIHPSIVLVHGDTNTTLGAALAAVKLKIPVAHIEAGLRSFDYEMPEEINRMLVDRISSFLFAPTEIAYKNLIHEGTEEKSIFITGNTIVDVLSWYEEKISTKNIHKKSFQSYALVTMHRAENVDSKKQLKQLIDLLYQFSSKTHLQLLWPMHPRTEKKLKEFGLTISNLNAKIIPPVNYFQMISFLKNASVLLTDSGGLQEEAYILHKPLITLRTSTERPETMGANIIAGLNIRTVMDGWKKYENGFGTWGNELGDGKASVRIIDILEKIL